jgi:hypothetical protein
MTGLPLLIVVLFLAPILAKKRPASPAGGGQIKTGKSLHTRLLPYNLSFLA